MKAALEGLLRLERTVSSVILSRRCANACSSDDSLDSALCLFSYYSFRPSVSRRPADGAPAALKQVLAVALAGRRQPPAPAGRVPAGARARAPRPAASPSAAGRAAAQPASSFAPPSPGDIGDKQFAYRAARVLA